jgi:hypothetical protein
MVSGNYLKKRSFTGLDVPDEKNGIQMYDFANLMPLILEGCKTEN